MTNKGLIATLVLGAVVALGGAARAGGIVENAGKEATKGVVKGVQQAVDTGNLTRGAKQVTKGVIDGAADAAPLVTSQIANQANINKKAIGKVARQVAGDAAAGAIGATASQMQRSIGEDGEGPMADAMVALTERTAAALVRGIRSELPDYKIHIPVWTYVLAFGAGALSVLVSCAGIFLLYLLFSRRRAVVLMEQGQRGGAPLRVTTTHAVTPAHGVT